jgi:hypothetical protein
LDSAHTRPAKSWACQIFGERFRRRGLAKPRAEKVTGRPNNWKGQETLAFIQTNTQVLSQRQNIGLAVVGSNPNIPLLSTTETNKANIRGSIDRLEKHSTSKPTRDFFFEHGAPRRAKKLH